MEINTKLGLSIKANMEFGTMSQKDIIYTADLDN